MFLIGKLLTMTMMPTALLIELLLLGLLFRRHRTGRMLVGGVAALLALCLVCPVDQWAIRPLEDRFPQVRTLPPHVDGIIVLGGSIDDLLSEERQTPVTGQAGDRLTAFATLARHYLDAKLVFTGGSGDVTKGVTNEAKWAKILLAGIGLPSERVVWEDRSRTTRENATDSFTLVHPKPDETWLLVTSASHMPRSMGVFRRIGWNVTPYPVGYLSREHLRAYSLSLGSRMAVLDWAAHEWIGLTAYRMRGWTDTFFPAPLDTPKAR